MEWHPIETAPKDGTEILAFDGVCIENIKWMNGIGNWVTSWNHDVDYTINGDPTHWMHLPEPPQ